MTVNLASLFRFLNVAQEQVVQSVVAVEWVDTNLTQVLLRAKHASRDFTHHLPKPRLVTPVQLEGMYLASTLCIVMLVRDTEHHADYMLDPQIYCLQR